MLRLPLVASYALTHTSFCTPEMRKKGKNKIRIFLLIQTYVLVARSRRWCCKKSKIKLGKSLDLGLLLAMKEWVARDGKKMRNALYF